MKLDYEYFLMRRNLTTEQLIRNNNVNSYEEFCTILLQLRVKPPSEEIFNLTFSAIKSIEKNNDDKEKQGLRGKKNSTRKTTTRSTRIKKGGNAQLKKQEKEMGNRTASSIRKEKST
jgi:hypothetical protein